MCSIAPKLEARVLETEEDGTLRDDNVFER